MREDDIPLGGGNIWAILITGILMFVFYLCGWSALGTGFLVLFLIAGFHSLFPLIAAFIAFARLCVVLSVDGAVLGVLIIWIVILLLVELAARSLMKEEAEKGNSEQGRK